MYSEFTSSNLQWPSSDFDSIYAQNEDFNPETENAKNENVCAGETDEVFGGGIETMCERKEITYATQRVSFQRPSVESYRSTHSRGPGHIVEESEEEIVTENVYYEPPELWGDGELQNSNK